MNIGTLSLAVLFILAIVGFGISFIYLAYTRPPRTGGFPASRRGHR